MSSTQRERYRPAFHFTARTGWLNDPNGLVYHKGEYHLFFQHDPSPTGRAGENMHWGHAVSPDLVHWTQLPIALFPDSRFGQKYSGSAIVDIDNVAGFAENSTPPLLLFYTAVGEKGFVQCCSYSLDNGRSFAPYSGNPILSELSHGNRDPKIFLHEESRQWVMVLWVDKGFMFFTSQNLLEWKKISYLEGFFECPDLFKLPVGNEPDEHRWVLVNGNGDYCIGRFDGYKFTSETERLVGDHGNNFYATQTWNNHPDNRIVQIAWMGGGRYPEMPFNQQMSFPCELSLHRTKHGFQLYRYPITELVKLYGESEEYTDIDIAASENRGFELDSFACDIEMEISIHPCDELRIDLSGHLLNYNGQTKRASFLNKTADVEMEQDVLKIRFLIDTTSIELFFNDGIVSMSNCVLFEGNGLIMRVFTGNFPARIKSLRITKLSDAF